MTKSGTLTAAVVGCKMGAGHAAAIRASGKYELAALCDINEKQAAEVGARNGNPPIFTDYDAMLRSVHPDVVAIATPNNLHCGFTLKALAAGVRGICCEKPMAVNMSEARSMVTACKNHGIPLVINHQRRMDADLIAAKQMIDNGAIGEVKLIRGQCQGDILSDGTHLIDSVQWLTGDRGARWVLGQVHRDLTPDPRLAAKNQPQFTGMRYGHPVEKGGMAVIQLESGIRLEMFCGDMVEERCPYQSYKVYGSAGTLWRSGDFPKPNLFVNDVNGGGWEPGIDGWMVKPVPAKEGVNGGWRPVELSSPGYDNPMTGSYRLLADIVCGCATDHPMSGETALRGFEIVMGIYESARLNSRLSMPLAQEQYPLELMVRERAFERRERSGNEDRMLDECLQNVA